MPQISIPFFTPTDQSTNDIANSSSATSITDAYLEYIDNKLFAIKRPGLGSFVTLGSSAAVDGVYYWEAQDILVAVSGGNVYSVDEAGTSTSMGSGLSTGVRPTFTEFSQGGNDYLAMANGGAIYVSTNGAAVAALSDTDAPTTVTHVVFLDQYLLANKAGTGRIYYSQVGDYTDWQNDFVTAEARGDDVLAVRIGWRDIYLFGTTTTEVWYNDGSTPFVRYDGREIQLGLSAKHSVQYIDNTWFFLDNRRRLVKVTGTEPQILSSPFDKKLSNLTTVSDAISDNIQVGGKGFYVITFPSVTRADGGSGQTYCYDYKLNAWYEWGEWNTAEAWYDRFKGNCVAFAHPWGKHYVGDRAATGKVYLMAETTYQDNSEPIKMQVDTAYIDHGTYNKKKCKRATFRIKRGVSGLTTDTTFNLRYRDNDMGSFIASRDISVGLTGDSTITVKQDRLGSYRQRQYRLTHSANTEFIIGDAQEDSDVLSR